MASNNKVTIFRKFYNKYNVYVFRRTLKKLNYVSGLVNHNDILINELPNKVEALNSKYGVLIKDMENFESGNCSELTKVKAREEKLTNKHYWRKKRLEVLKNKMIKKGVSVEEAERIHLERVQELDNKFEELMNLCIEKNTRKAPNSKTVAELEETLKQKEGLLLASNANKKAKLEKKNERLNVKIEKMNERSEVLHQRIIDFNNDLLEEEKLSLEAFEQLETLTTKQEAKVSNIKAKLRLLENDDTHLLISGLKMYFGGLRAVDDLSFEVKKGEVFGLIGPNGAGKTTVFNAITQFYTITGGDIFFRNKEGEVVDLTKLNPNQIVSEGIARSFQNIELVQELNILDNLLVASHSLLTTGYFAHAIHSTKMKREETVLREKAMELLRMLKIEGYAYFYPGGLPYGILKKVELARTLMTNPTLIILDEPAAGLNEDETIELSKTIKEIANSTGTTIFLVEHDMGLVMSTCDRICAISFGKKLAIGTPNEIKNHPDVQRAYLGDESDE